MLNIYWLIAAGSLVLIIVMVLAIMWLEEKFEQNSYVDYDEMDDAG